MDKKDIKQVLLFLALILLVVGLIKVMFPIIVLGLIVYAMYIIVRGPKS